MSNILPGFSHEDSETIDFVIACLFSTAIDISELRAWCVYVIDKTDFESIPPYLFDLMDFDQTLNHLYEVIGFVTGWEPADDERNALYGIAVQRGRKLFDASVTENEALALINKHPSILERFRQTFPFIALP